MTRPLEGVRVLDLTRLLPGGFATLIMADLGADVLKIEEPGKGDYVRWTPPFDRDVSAGHLALNRSKRSMTLNLKHERGREILLRLVRDADVLIESFRPGVMERLGVGYEALRAQNPRLVYCAITGYGQDGPYRAKAGHDINYLGYAGVLGLTGPAGGDPVIPGVQIGDLGGGALMALGGMLAALYDRERSGEGRFVDISMTDGAMAWLSFHAQAHLFEGGEPPRRGEMRLSGGMACYQIYRCGDGKHVTVGALEPQFWATLCTALGVPELIPKHLGDEDTQREMIEILSSVFASMPRDEWVAALADLDACVGPVNNLDEALADPHLRSRAMIVAIGDRTVLGNPVRLSGSESRYRDAPGFGDATEAVLSAAGYAGEEIAALRDSGAI
ncbi:MAG TPA: CaiB/BaiF CoA-transferase family protein [Actinomycetota bacterium]